MKKAGKIICVALIAILVVIMIISNNSNAYDVNLNSSAESVEAGKDFSITMNFNNATGLSGELDYDKDVFEYVGYTKIDALTANESAAGTISFLYFPQNNEKEISNVTFNFKAKDSVSDSKSGDIGIKDGSLTVISSDNTTYNSNNITGTLKKTITVTPKQEQKTQLALDQSNVTLVEGDTTKVNTTSGTVKSWESSNSGIASVDNNGTITGVAQGTVVITAIGDNNNATVNVTVNKKQQQEAGAPVLSKSNVTITVGSNETVTADKSVTWASSDTNIATVDNSGTIIGVAQGTVIITATDSNGKSSAVSVTVSSSNSENNSENNSKNNEKNGKSTSETNKSTETSKNTTSSTNGVIITTGNSSSSANDVVPSTGETSTEIIIVLAIITLIVAAIIFKNKAK